MGHATVLIEHGGVSLLTDPVLRRRILHLRRHPPLPASAPRAEAVLLSHLHYDHADLPSLRMLGSGTRILAPAGAAPLLRGAGLEHVEELRPGEAASVGEVQVTATPAKHSPRRRPLGVSAVPVGFVTKRGPSVYFAGDTDLFPEMAALPDVDVALLPVAGWSPKLGPGHLDPERAARAAALIRPRIAVPIHWGTLHAGRRGPWFTDPPHAFASHAARLAPEVDVRILAPGESLSL